MFTPTADAAAVLESPAAAAASVGDSFGILARGRGGFWTDSIEEFTTNYQTQMSLSFLIARRGERGVLLQVLAGKFSLNDTLYSFIDGIGFAGRPQDERLNETIVFGFRVNVTDSQGESGQLEFIGRVRRTDSNYPFLVMRGKLTFGDLAFVFAQIGRIYKIQS
jgi:hypothetical protein